MDYTLYTGSLFTALVLMLFFALYFLIAKTPEKPIFDNYVRSRRLMGVALLTLSANYSVHLFMGIRFTNPDTAILMNLSTYFLCYWIFSTAFIALLNRQYLTIKRALRNIFYWIAFSIISLILFLVIPHGIIRDIGLICLPVWLLCYGLFLSRKVIVTYRQAVRIFDDTHSEHISAYIRWMSICTWWALIYGVSCGIWTFLPNKYVYLWILSSIPFYIYIYCSYMNYLLFYEQVESILEEVTNEDSNNNIEDSTQDIQNSNPAYHAIIEKNLPRWIENNGFTKPGLTIEELATILGTNRTYLSSYIKTTFHVSFREWIADHRIEYAKCLFRDNTNMTVEEVSTASGFQSLSYFTKIFAQKEGETPSKWKKQL